MKSMQRFNGEGEETQFHLILNMSYDHVFDVHFHVFPLFILF